MRKMMIPMLFVLLLQALLFVGTIIFGGTVDQLNRNAFDILNERVINRKNYIENEMQRWTSINGTVQKINSETEELVGRSGITVGDLSANSPVTAELLDIISQDLIDSLQKQSVTGAFVVLNGQDDPEQTFDVAKAGIYLRDMNPISNPEDNSDLLIERASSVITQKLGIPMDTGWSPQFHFTEEFPAESYNYYYKPFRAALEYPEISYSDLCYWSKPFQLSTDDISIITYSVPLISNGVPYGVFGIELSVDYLKSMLPYDEIASDKAGSYLLTVTDADEMEFENLLSSGPVFRQLYGDEGNLRIQKRVYGDSFLLQPSARASGDMYGCVQYFKLYNSNTPFEDDRWGIIGMVKGEKLLGFSTKVGMTVAVSLAVSLVAGLLIVLVISRIVTKPITQLARKVKNSNPHLPVKLDKTRIAEIDQLAKAVESLSDSVAESASKLSKIIEMTSTAVGAFELNKKDGNTFYTEHLFEIFGLQDDYSTHGMMDNRIFLEKLEQTRQFLDEANERDRVWLYQVRRQTGGPGWARLRVVVESDRIIGVAEDVTQQIIEKKKIEYERDYDLLTNLLNRRAFYNLLVELFSRPEQLKTGAMMMFDLDNLKYINDAYGHDYGDQYIRCAADILRKNTPASAVVSRMSGDEFYIFLYGCEEKGQVLDTVEQIKQGLAETLFPLPDDATFRVRASAGIAWYPDDAVSYEQLIRYADFAMYTVKHTVKGQVMQFNIEEYQKDSYLLHNKEELNKLIDERLIEYHFQPIVVASTGEVFAYEALMRSKVDTLKSPLEILTLARSQSKLYEIERLTWFCSMEAFVAQDQIPPDVRIFLNSIANQNLSQQDFAEFEQLYRPHLSRIVVELTEEEKQNSVFSSQKQECIRLWQASLALDDFGTGYNGEAMLLCLTPQYVKIDMSIIRNVDTDKNRQKILQNLLSYTKERQIKVIAEGVETRGEMETLIRTGVDYLQGYYIGMPQKTASPVNPEVIAQIQAINRNKKLPVPHRPCPKS